MKISFVNGVRSGDEVEFALPEITIGREDGNIVRIPTEGVSRYHARLRQNSNGAWTVVDQGSTNGVKLNGVRIAGERTIAEGDLLEIGDQMIRVSDLDTEPPKVIFNPIPTTSSNPVPEFSERPFEPSIAPGTGVKLTPQVGGESTPDKEKDVIQPETVNDKDEKKVSQLETAFGDGKNFELFKKTKTKKHPDGADESEAKPRRRLSNVTFYTIIICVVVVVITACVKILSPVQTEKKEDGTATLQKPMTVYYEKTIQTSDNVFRFTMQLEDGLVSFVLDDVKTLRNVARLNLEIGKTSLDVLRGQLENSGVWTMASPSAPRTTEKINRRLVLAEPGRVVDIRVAGKYLPTEFERAEAAINALAEQFGLQTIAMTAEELKSQAEASFVKAEQLYANREALPSNLRDAINRYRLTVNYLDQFSPHPAIWDQARRRLEEAQQIRKHKLDVLNSEVSRLAALKDYGKLKEVYQEVMELMDVNSVAYDNARRGLFAVDNALRGKQK